MNRNQDVSGKRVLLILGCSFGTVGLLLLGIGAFSLVSTRSFLATAESVPGTVIDVVARRSIDSDGFSSNSYYPIVEFTAIDGERYKFESNTGSNPPSFKEGQAVTVLYNPENTDQAKIQSFFSLWGLVLIAGLLGVIFSLIGGGLLFGALKS